MFSSRGWIRTINLSVNSGALDQSSNTAISAYYLLPAAYRLPPIESPGFEPGLPGSKPGGLPISRRLSRRRINQSRNATCSIAFARVSEFIATSCHGLSTIVA